MFERASNCNQQQNQQLATPSVPANLTLDDGSVLKGKFHISGSKRIYDVLNGSGLFLDFEKHTGERELIAKSTIRAIKLVTVPRAPSLPTAAAQANDPFQPHQILGVKNGAAHDDIREAYHRLSKVYHPDRYANSGLPREVLAYLNNSSRRINAAFDALKQQHLAKTAAPKPPTSVRAQPIYTSRNGTSGDRK